MRTFFIKFILLLFFALFITTTIHAQGKTNQQSFQEESLFYAGKVWGFVKYYHPEARLGKFDIDSSLVVLLDKVSETKNLKERNTVLNQWVANFGKITEFEKFVVKDSSQYKLFYDYSWLENQTFDKKLSKQLIDIKNAKRTDSCYYVEHYDIVPNFNNEKAITLDFSKPHLKFIPFLRYWNAIEYFYPYKYLTDKKWDDVLKEYIPIFRKTEKDFEWNTVIRFLIAEINDGHSHFEYRNQPIPMRSPYKKNVLPIELIYSKDKFIVTGLSPFYVAKERLEDYGLEIGDEIVSVNERDPNELMKNEIAKYLAFSNFNYLCNTFYYSLLQSDTTFIDISYKREGNVITNRLETSKPMRKEFNIVSKEKFKITNDSIAYINLEAIPSNSTYEMIHKIRNTKGIIVDMRGYPNYEVYYPLATSLFSNLSIFSTLSISNKKEPGIFKTYIHASCYIGNSNPLSYKGYVVILVNSSVLSSSEFATMQFQQHPNAITIGNSTAGADGNVTYIPLTDQISVGFSSVGVYYPDGGETQRVGVRIDEKVYPTPKGIKEERDELVERAIEIIRAK